MYLPGRTWILSVVLELVYSYNMPTLDMKLICEYAVYRNDSDYSYRSSSQYPTHIFYSRIFF
jgi:hypothetical protein